MPVMVTLTANLKSIFPSTWRKKENGEKADAMQEKREEEEKKEVESVQKCKMDGGEGD